MHLPDDKALTMLVVRLFIWHFSETKIKSSS